MNDDTNDNNENIYDVEDADESPLKQNDYDDGIVNYNTNNNSEDENIYDVVVADESLVGKNDDDIYEIFDEDKEIIAVDAIVWVKIIREIWQGRIMTIPYIGMIFNAKSLKT